MMQNTRQRQQPILNGTGGPNLQTRRGAAVRTRASSVLYTSAILGLITTLVGITLFFLVKLEGMHMQEEPATMLRHHSSSVLGVQPQQQNEIIKEDNKPISGHDKPSSTSLDTISAVKNEFYERYGGKDAAEAMLARGIQRYDGSEKSIDPTARRMVRAVSQNNPFVIAFGGYSVTVGRGNYFNQSFPFVMERVLQKSFQQVLGIDLVVRNAAIGGIPSFPYGWCLENFMGNDADVVSWDYGMNEGKDSAVMESYIRHAMQLPKRPMFILVDTNPQRRKMLGTYTENGILSDPISINSKGAFVDKELLNKPDEEKPIGFRNWNEFGAPDGCPGRSSWHPKKMEHELIGWMLAMHLLQAVERAHEIIKTEPDWKQRYATTENPPTMTFPAPIGKPPPNDKSVTQLMYGHESDSKYIMKDLSCRTSFLPTLHSDKDLTSVVVSGMTNTNMDIMQERGDDVYNSGWVPDVSKIERDTKLKVERCGGLGYIDMKISLYGITESGTLRLWLPYEGPVHDGHDDSKTLDANHWFDDLIICEANEKRKEEACKLDADVRYVVGGVEVPSQSVSSIDGAGVYLNRKTCYNIGIPANAKITRLADVKASDGTNIALGVRRHLHRKEDTGDSIGLIVDVSAVGADVTRENGACCLSHIIWEQH